MTKTLSTPLRALLLATAFALAGLAHASTFRETTRAHGKTAEVAKALSGVWLLVAESEVVPGKFKTFAQLVRIATSSSQPELHLLDVEFPEDVAGQLREANYKTLAPWKPTGDQLAALSKSWSALPPARKDRTTDLIFDSVEFTVAAPDAFGEVFPSRDAGLEKALDGSQLALYVNETYRPNPVLADKPNMGQLMSRRSVYGLRKIEKQRVAGESTIGMLAAGNAGTPVPFTFRGPFVMYRLDPA